MWIDEQLAYEMMRHLRQLSSIVHCKSRIQSLPCCVLLRQGDKNGQRNLMLSGARGVKVVQKWENTVVRTTSIIDLQHTNFAAALTVVGSKSVCMMTMMMMKLSILLCAENPES